MQPKTAWGRMYQTWCIYNNSSNFINNQNQLAGASDVLTFPIRAIRQVGAASNKLHIYVDSSLQRLANWGSRAAVSGYLRCPPHSVKKNTSYANTF